MTIESIDRINRLVHQFKEHQKKKSSYLTSKTSELEPPNTIYIANNNNNTALTTTTATTTQIKSKQTKNIFQSFHRSIRMSWHRTKLLLIRSCRQAFRDLPTLAVRFATSGVLALIVSSVYGEKTGRRELTKDNVGDRVNILGQAVVQVGEL